MSLLQAAVGVARDDPVRRLLVGCDAVYGEETVVPYDCLGSEAVFR